MPWKECDVMSQRKELLGLASMTGSNRSELARRFGVSRQTLYKWLERQVLEGGLSERSRRPRESPWRTPSGVEAMVLEVRAAHPAWGGRKIRGYLMNQGRPRVPAASTITAILHRHQQISPEASEASRPWLRFERASSNDLWQSDFKGDFALVGGGRCYPLTMVDDHSRYALCLEACLNQQWQTVKGCWEQAFRRYGLPRAMLMDNGAPWGVSHAPESYTRLEVWLMRLDVRVLHGRPYHPQTQGKEERFHRTLKLEVLQGRQFEGLESVQRAFDPWRDMYNHDRPHEALGQKPPSTRYQPSPRRHMERLAELEYGAEKEVRTPNPVGQLNWRGRQYKLGEAFGGQRLGIGPADQDGVRRVYFGRFWIGILDERDGSGRMVRPRHGE